ncbi:uncharacterized protein [Elaeis guineensis]|uniref:uncharacterized protein isoform X7 n=1 Tax=Elaeis guineensis var. tenera TaxID=51953 RepID=UPI003C6DA06C
MRSFQMPGKQEKEEGANSRKGAKTKKPKTSGKLFDGSLHLTDSNPLLLKPSLLSSSSSYSNLKRRGRRLLPRASLRYPTSKTRCQLPPIPLALAPLVGPHPPPARSDEPALSEWERVYLTIDPGVVLLDIAFVPDDLNHAILATTQQSSCKENSIYGMEG